jgi:hypothetical protein
VTAHEVIQLATMRQVKAWKLPDMDGVHIQYGGGRIGFFSSSFLVTAHPRQIAQTLDDMVREMYTPPDDYWEDDCPCQMEDCPGCKNLT